MKRYLYCYQTSICFSTPIKDHALLLRCQPARAAYMNVEEEHLVIPSSMKITSAIDAMGNRIVYGNNNELHSSLAYVSTGIVSMEDYAETDGHVPLAAFRQPTPLTAVPDSLTPSTTGHAIADAEAICHHVHEQMTYKKGVTTIDTPASKVAVSMEGVCQDYAHLMIGLCHNCSITARYACGLLEGEGETHAWVEVHDGFGWKGFDPTHDCRINYGYLKIAHGRNAADCPVSRGLYVGNANEQTQVSVMLKEI